MVQRVNFPAIDKAVREEREANQAQQTGQAMTELRGQLPGKTAAERRPILEQMATYKPQEAAGMAAFYGRMDEEEKSQMRRMNDDLLKFSFLVAEDANPEQAFQKYKKLLPESFQAQAGETYDPGKIRYMQLRGAETGKLFETAEKMKFQKAKSTLTREEIKLRGKEARKTVQLSSDLKKDVKKLMDLTPNQFENAVKRQVMDEFGEIDDPTEVNRIMGLAIQIKRDNAEIEDIDAIMQAAGTGGAAAEAIGFDEWASQR